MGALLRLKTAASHCFLTAAMDPVDPVYVASVETWAVEFLHCLVPRLQGWQCVHDIGTDTTVFSRGTLRTTTVLEVERLYHGTTLDIVYEILRSGFRVGDGHHKARGETRNGMFAMQAPDGYEAQARRLALERATVSRSTELAGCWPATWSTPVVLGIHVPSYLVLNLDAIGVPPLHKVCIEMGKGTVANLDALSVLGYVEAAHIVSIVY